jgi:predicted RNase H-like nuclease (RuvC/YqgF family)
VSSDAADIPEMNGADWERLESSLQRLLSEFEVLQRRSAEAEERVRQLEATLRTSSTSAGDLDPVALANRVSLLEQENRFLARRLDRARDSVKRISARLQFLDEDR